MSQVGISRGPRGFMEADGDEIYYETFGAGDSMVLCHGLGGNHAIWYQQVVDLARDFHVVTWDQRGFGRSTNRGTGCNPETAARDLGRLLDHLDIECAALVGQSMGGWAALGLALARPARVSRLVLADTIAGVRAPAAQQLYREFRDAAAASTPTDRLPLGHHPALGPRLRKRDPSRAFLFEQIGDTPPPLQARMRELLGRTSFAIDRVAQFERPVLFVVGADDPIFPPRAVREVAGFFHDARIVEIPDAGHSPYFELPEAWNRAVREFLSGAHDGER